MTTKEYLQQITNHERLAQMYMRQIAALRAQMYGVKGISYEKDKVQTSPDDNMINLIAKADELTRKWMETAEQLIREKEEIVMQIGMVEHPSYRWVLTYRYVDGMRWTQVAAAMGLTDMRHLYRMHGRALRAFEKVRSDHCNTTI